MGKTTVNTGIYEWEVPGTLWSSSVPLIEPIAQAGADAAHVLETLDERAARQGAKLDEQHRFCHLTALHVRSIAENLFNGLDPALIMLDGLPPLDDCQGDDPVVSEDCPGVAKTLDAAYQLKLAIYLGRMHERLLVQWNGERNAAAVRKSRKKAAGVQKRRSQEKAECWKAIFDEVRPTVRDNEAAWVRVAELAEECADAGTIPDYCGVKPKGKGAYSPSTIRQKVKKFFPTR